MNAWDYTDTGTTTIAWEHWALGLDIPDPAGAETCQYIGHINSGQLDGRCVYCGQPENT